MPATLPHPAVRLAATLGAALAAGGCAGARRCRWPAPLTLAAPFAADSQTVAAVAPGVLRRTLHVARGPWAVHLLDVDPARCWTLRAVKGTGRAAGRTATLALARALDSAGGAPVAGAVNADFFSFAPAGVPVGLHVENGVVLAGPAVGGPERPSLLVPGDGPPRIATVATRGALVVGADTLPVVAWNRGLTGQGASAPPAALARAAGLALFDAHYGARTDSAPGRLFVRLAPIGGGRAVVAGVDSGDAAAIARDRVVAVAGAGAAGSTRAALRALRAGVDTVRLALSLDVPMPRQAVSGGPRLVRDGGLAPEIDAFGAADFRARNPRTAVGLTASGRVLLVAVDGRQPGYSAGMTTRELAELLRALGARDALNLDGGGSTTLVVRDRAGALTVANRPSDAGGERSVGNALAVVGGCADRDSIR